MITIAMVTFIVTSKKDFGPMAKAEERTRETGKLMNEGARPMVSDEITSYEMKVGVKPRAINMVIPLATMILMMVVTSLRLPTFMDAIPNPPAMDYLKHGLLKALPRPEMSL